MLISLCSCQECRLCTAQAHKRRHMQLSLRDMQKFYTKIEDRPQVREVVTTFKEHHPIEKVSCSMRRFVTGSPSHAQHSGPPHACSSQLQHCFAPSREQHVRPPRGMLQSLMSLVGAWLGHFQKPQADRSQRSG